jgi:DNA-binding XRE family transcriptional regulator
MYRKLELSTLVAANAREARARIVEAYMDAGCSRQDAAHALGVSKRTLARFVDSLELTAKLATLEAKALRDGWHHGRLGGRPLGARNRSRRVAA